MQQEIIIFFQHISIILKSDIVVVFLIDTTKNAKNRIPLIHKINKGH